MIAHDAHAIPRTIRDAGSLVAEVLRRIGVPRPGFTVKPDLGGYQLAGPVPEREPVVPFFVPVRCRDGKRVDPASERSRIKLLISRLR